MPSDRARRTIQAIVDPLIAMLAVVVALWLRYDADIPQRSIDALPWVAALVAVGQGLSGWLQGLYAGRWRFGSFEEVFALVRATGMSSIALLGVNLLFDLRPVPVGACLAQFGITVLLCSAVRWAWRIVLERALRPSGTELARVVIVGAGEAGASLVTSMMRNPDGRYLPVALADDDPMKRNLRIAGVPVLGAAADVCAIAQQAGATTMVLALPSADGEAIRRLAASGSACGLQVLVLPPVQELLGAPDASDVRPITEADLLGRRQIETDIDAIAHYIAGRRVLVTGAGGSIGSELCRQLNTFAPAALVMLDRDESALHGVQLSIEGRALLDDRNLVVADIRDAYRLGEVFAEHQPDVVFHAAALKHLPLLEMHPTEALKSNCQGTQNLLELAIAYDVEHFVNISTDKAADPSSVLGASKRLAERLTAQAATRSPGVYVSVRFGNVLGSRGSVLTAFRAQIDAGGPVTVTDPDVTRYFMTVEEAVQLVIQAGAIGRDGRALVLDMGEPVKIDDVARRLVEQASRTVDIVYTGLRPGEKMHEVLLGSDEDPQPTGHPLINSVDVDPIDPAVLVLLSAVAPAALPEALHRHALDGERARP